MCFVSMCYVITQAMLIPLLGNRIILVLTRHNKTIPRQYQNIIAAVALFILFITHNKRKQTRFDDRPSSSPMPHI